MRNSARALTLSSAALLSLQAPPVGDDAGGPAAPARGAAAARPGAHSGLALPLPRGDDVERVLAVVVQVHARHGAPPGPVGGALAEAETSEDDSLVLVGRALAVHVQLALLEAATVLGTLVLAGVLAGGAQPRPELVQQALGRSGGRLFRLALVVVAFSLDHALVHEPPEDHNQDEQDVVHDEACVDASTREAHPVHGRTAAPWVYFGKLSWQTILANYQYFGKLSK